MSQRTPGKWKQVRFNQQAAWRKEIWTDRKLVATLSASGDFASKEELERLNANAVLAELSPFMADTLQAIAEYPVESTDGLHTNLLLAQTVDGIASSLLTFSQGPWNVHPSGYPNWRRDVTDANGRLVACCTIQTPERNEAALAEIVANATLIAAAPTMLAAIKAIAATPADNPRQAHNAIQLIAIKTLYGHLDFSGVTTAKAAQQLAGILPLPRPEPAASQLVKNRFRQITGSHWQAEYMGKHEMGVVDLGAERRLAVVIDAARDTRELILAAPRLLKALNATIERLEYLQQNTGTQGDRDYITRIFSGKGDPRTLPDTPTWNARAANPSCSRFYVPEDDLPIASIAHAKPEDLELMQYAPDLLRNLEYAIAALESLSEKAQSKVDRHYANKLLEGHLNPREVLESVQRAIRPQRTNPSFGA